MLDETNIGVCDIYSHILFIIIEILTLHINLQII